MSYHCGTYGLERLGIPSDCARIECDTCGARKPVIRSHGICYAWFERGKAPPGWIKAMVGVTRRDYCPKCQ